MKSFLKVLLLGALFQSALALAAGQPFTQAQFDALTQEGKPVIVHVHATWCPTCKVQDPILSELMKSPEFGNVTLLEVDFDKQKDILKEFNVSMQSTLIAFKGGKEQARSTGDTKQPSIEVLSRKVL